MEYESAKASCMVKASDVKFLNTTCTMLDTNS